MECNPSTTGNKMSEQILSVEELQNIISNIDPIYVFYKSTWDSEDQLLIKKGEVAINFIYPIGGNNKTTAVTYKIGQEDSIWCYYDIDYFELTKPIRHSYISNENRRNAIMNTFIEEIKQSDLL